MIKLSGWDHHEKFTIKIDSRLCYMISEALDLLEESKMYKSQPFSDWIMLNKESFHNLGNHKVAEVNEVTLLNPMNIEVLKREPVV